MELLVFFAFAFILPFLFIKRRDDNETEPILDKKTSLFIKGILCIFVMIHNLGLDYLPYKFGNGDDYKGWLWITRRITEATGGIAVGLFFFLSAFGLFVSYKKYGNEFLKKLIFKNALKLWLVAVGINLLEFVFFFGNSFETGDAILRILNLDLFNNFNRMNRHGWFIASLLALYVIFAVTFYLFNKMKNEKKLEIAAMIVIGITLILKLLSIIFDRGGMYTRELPGFAIGIAYGLYYEKVNEFSRKHFTPIVIISLITYICCLFHYEPAATWAACLLVITVLQKYKFNNKVVEYLGSICLGIYLFLHFTTLVLSPYLIENVWAWMFGNAAFILVLSVLLDFLIKGISFAIKKIENNKEVKPN